MNALCAKLTAVCVALLAAAPLYGQSEVTATSQGAAFYSAPAVQETYTSDLEPQNPYLGGVPTGKASSTVLSLSLEDAVRRGLQQNLGGLLSTDAVSESHGERWRALSALLPNVTTGTSFGVNQIDLKAAFGLDIPGVPKVIEEAKAAIAAGEKQVAAAQARIREAEADEVKTGDDVERYHLLLVKDEVPKQIYDHALAAAQTDTAAVAAARADEATAEQNVQQARSRLIEAIARNESARAGPQRVASTRARALSAVADVRQRKAELEQAELNLGYTKILAPVSGEVTKKVVVGLNVEPGEQLLTVVPLDEVWITANFKETQLRHMRPGQRADITCDSNGRSYHGHVDSIAGATGPLFSLLPPENATGNYVKILQRVPVKIVVDPGENRDRQLRPGMNVEAKVYLQ